MSRVDCTAVAWIKTIMCAIIVILHPIIVIAVFANAIWYCLAKVLSLQFQTHERTIFTHKKNFEHKLERLWLRDNDRSVLDWLPLFECTAWIQMRHRWSKLASHRDPWLFILLFISYKFVKGFLAITFFLLVFF